MTPFPSKPAVFCLISFLLGLGFVCGYFLVNSLLVARVGTHQLFEVYLVSGLLSLPLWFLLYLFIDRFPRRPVLVASYVLFSGLIFVCWLILKASPSEFWIYLVVRVLFHSLYFFACGQFWLLASQYFKYYQTKKFYSLFVTCGVVGEMAGGLAMAVLARRIPPVHFILAWSAAFLAAAALASRLPRSPYLPHVDDAPRPVAEKVEADLPSSGTADFDKSSRGLILSLFSFWSLFAFLSYGTDYVFNATAEESLHDEGRIASLYGAVSLASALFLLLYQRLSAGFVALRSGLAGSVQMITAVMALSLVAVRVFPSLAAIAIAEAVVFLLIDSVSTGRLNMILNIFPDANRGRMKVVTEGLGRAFGVILLYLATRLVGIERETVLNLVAMTAILHGSIFPWFFRRYLTTHLLAHLRSRRSHVLANVIQALGVRNNEAAVKPLLELLRRSESVNLKGMIVLSLGKIRDRQAFNDIVGLFSPKDEGFNLSVIKALSEYDNYQAMYALLSLVKYPPRPDAESRMNAGLFLAKLVGKKIMPFLIEALLDPDARIRANAIEAMAVLRDRKALPLIERFLEDENRRIRANAIMALYPHRRYRREASRRLEALLRSQDPVDQRAALYAVGLLKAKKFKEDAADLLKASGDTRVRLYAAFALACLHDPRSIEPYWRLLHGSDPEQRSEAERLLTKLPEGGLEFLLATGRFGDKLTPTVLMQEWLRM